VASAARWRRHARKAPLAAGLNLFDARANRGGKLPPPPSRSFSSQEGLCVRRALDSRVACFAIGSFIHSFSVLTAANHLSVKSSAPLSITVHVIITFDDNARDSL
jgi:hypothetical protein